MEPPAVHQPGSSRPAGGGVILLGRGVRPLQDTRADRHVVPSATQAPSDLFALVRPRACHCHTRWSSLNPQPKHPPRRRCRYHHLVTMALCWHLYTVRSSLGLPFLTMNYLVHSVRCRPHLPCREASPVRERAQKRAGLVVPTRFTLAFHRPSKLKPHPSPPHPTASR